VRFQVIARATKVQPPREAAVREILGEIESVARAAAGLD